MKYYLDQEFHERFYKPLFGKKHHIIELISIGIVAEDGRTYSAISKDFDVKAAWKNVWLRNNVLKAIWNDHVMPGFERDYEEFFTYSNMKWLVNRYGISNKQIAKEVKEFCQVVPTGMEGLCYCSCADTCPKGKIGMSARCHESELTDLNTPEFYGYYADYDWVLFCSLFGSMINLPEGFPMYCKDLKQMLDEKVMSLHGKRIVHFTQNRMNYGFDGVASIHPVRSSKEINFDTMSFESKLDFLKKEVDSYPKQKNEHLALADAMWNKKLHEFISKL